MSRYVGIISQALSALSWQSSLSLRSRVSVDDDELEKTIKYAHSIGKKVYAAVNIYAFDEKYDAMDDFALVDELSKIGNVAVPQAIEEIRNAEIRHDTVCEVEEMPVVVKQFLGM